jgi:hypothetical protein
MSHHELSPAPEASNGDFKVRPGRSRSKVLAVGLAGSVTMGDRALSMVDGVPVAAAQ